MKTIFPYVFLLFLMSGCHEQTNEPVMSPALERWRSYNIHNYSIEQVHSCFCPNSSIRMKLTVRSDTVVSVMRLSDSSMITFPDSKQYLSIDSLFGIIQYAGADSLVYSFNSQYGYPEKLDINPQLHPVDGGILYETFNLQPTN